MGRFKEGYQSGASRDSVCSMFCGSDWSAKKACICTYIIDTDRRYDVCLDQVQSQYLNSSAPLQLNGKRFNFRAKFGPGSWTRPNSTCCHPPLSTVLNIIPAYAVLVYMIHLCPDFHSPGEQIMNGEWPRNCSVSQNWWCLPMSAELCLKIENIYRFPFSCKGREKHVGR